MSRSPFITPGQGRHRQPGARWRRRRGLLAAGAVLALAIAAALVVVMVLAKSEHRSEISRHGSTAASTRSARPSQTARPSAPKLSQTGLRLGKPPLTLTGLAAPQQDPVRLAFHTPPRGGLLFDLDSGRILWQRNASKRLGIASLTKMMTALLTVQSAPPSASVLVTKRAIDTNGSKVGVLPLGRHVQLESMLYGLLLPSGNDAALALAEHISGNASRFVARMNAEAAKLGLGCTRYADPSGYIDQDNYSCAADLAVLAHVELEQPRLARIVRTFRAVLPFPIKGGRLYIHNNNPLLIYGYPGLTGLKTGYTLAAGKCLVATAERHRVRLGVVLLDSPDPATQARQLLDSGFERAYHQPRVAEPPIPAGA
jgi:serine-type D-Ala-D-Ala carboxypeptidase (penicillin-binding protein 5/6)